MSRARLAFALIGVAAAIVVIVVLVGGTSEKSASSVGVSPSCLPATLDHSAKLPGLPVDVSPAPETGTADPHTQISFLGTPAANIHAISVGGERSGVHPGRLEAYSQGDGASFVPTTPFDAGERVTVHAMIGPAGNAKPVAFGFRVDTPYSTASVPPFPNPQAPPGDYHSFATLPGVQAPILNVTVADRDPGAGDILTSNGPSAGRYGPLIYTPKGRLVWFDQLSGDLSAENLSVQLYEGRRDLTFWQGKVLSLGFGQGEDVVLDDRYQTVARVPGGNGLKADLHDFQIAPHEVAYTTAYNPIRCDLSGVEGTRDGTILDTAVQAIDMKSGLVRWEWHSLDHVGVGESQTSPPKGTPWDWFHLNSIDVQPNGNVFISARSTWAGYQLQAGSGTILWRLGGLKSSFKMGPGTKTAWQHDGRVLSSGDITFFDNGSNPPIHQQSRAVRIALDFKTHEARLRSVRTNPSPLLSVSQGNTQTLSNGNVVVGYGAIPEVSEYAKDGGLLFDAHLPFVMSSYRSVRFPWSGRPLSAPAIAAELNSTREETVVHASWNGDTDVAAWRVLAGDRPGALQARATIPASDFESSTILPKKYAYVQVQALDGAGAALDSSPAVRVQ
ncbi:MAG: arylsulfotransferase family protein [Solirubrobacteraceae bacterium]